MKDVLAFIGGWYLLSMVTVCALAVIVRCAIKEAHHKEPNDA